MARVGSRVKKSGNPWRREEKENSQYPGLQIRGSEEYGQRGGEKEKKGDSNGPVIPQ